MPTDLAIAVAHLTSKKPRYDALHAYYTGDQPLVYSSSKLREVFHGLDARFIVNVCSVVVDSVLNRLALRTLQVAANEQADDALQAVREASGLVDDEYAIHEDVCVTGESFVLAWRNEDTGAIEAFQNDSRLCHAEYDGDNPRQMRFAAKWWNTAGIIRLNLYYTDRIEHYATVREFKAGEVPDERAFQPFGDESVSVNEWGVIPVFHFRSNRRGAKSQLQDAAPIQDMLNKLYADAMLTSEFMAFPQRYVISESGIQNLQNNPNAIWDLVASAQGAQPTSAGQFPAADLTNYLVMIDNLLTKLGVITSTPKHFFYAQGGDPSGEALIAMEAPLNRKVQQLQQTLAPTWRALGAFLLKLAGVNVPSREVWAQYEPAETVQPMTQAQVRELTVRAGVPLTTTLRDEGWDDADIAQMYEDAETERTQQATYAAAVLDQAQRQFDAGSVAA
jgi:hypothetical protein